MNEVETKVLTFLAERSREDADPMFYPFAPIIEETKLSRQLVRRACRSLKRKGLAEFASGLTDDDGKPAGAGYRATKAVL